MGLRDQNGVGAKHVTSALLKQGTAPYFSCSGTRAEFKWDEKKGREVSTGVTLPERVRLETIRLWEAEEFVTDVYKRENVLLAIHEVQRTPTP